MRSMTKNKIRTLKSGEDIVATGVAKKFGRKTVFSGLDVRVPTGSIVALTGPSGSGKSTLMSLLAGIDKPSRGVVEVPGRTQRGVIFQNYNLVGTMTAVENALLTARLLGKSPTTAAVQDTFAYLNIDGLEKLLPHQLSGGQQQRVAVARVLLARTPYIFADEPTGALDRTSARIVMDALRSAADAGAAVVLISHDAQTLDYADARVALGDAHAA